MVSLTELNEFNNTILGTLEKQDYILRLKAEDGDYFNVIYFFVEDDDNDVSHYECSHYLESNKEYYVLGYIALNDINLATMMIVDTGKWREVL